LEFLETRCCKQTQAELRDCANQIALLLKAATPVIFYGAGAKCGVCWNKERCK
jgi:thymidylate synthase ThyX